jgi:diguanylate cyclase
MTSVISQLFINAAIIIAFMSFGNQFIKEKGVNPSSPVYRKISVGIGSGVLGCLLMLYSINYISKVFIDLRYIPVIIMAFYASPLSAIITAVVIGVFRIIYFGLSQSSVIGFIAVCFVGVGCGLISKLNIRIWLKWVLAVLYTDFILSIAFIILLMNSPILRSAILSFSISTALASLLMYYFSEYTEMTNYLYRKMKEESKKDFLTGLYNMRQFVNLSSNVLKNAKETNKNISLLYIDVDYFKRVNDTYGHIEGDNVLKELGVIFSKTSRSFDIVSRNGGEEFSILLLDCSLEKSYDIAERIRKSIAQHDFVLSSGKIIKITVSIGISSFPFTTDNVENLIQQADIALYNAKQSGRNTIVVANKKM